MEQKRRLSREIANSNERRRMQSINCGYQTLLGLLRHPEEPKLSKAAILQQTTHYIHQLIREKTEYTNRKDYYLNLISQRNDESLGSSTESSHSSPQLPDSDVQLPRTKRIKTFDGTILDGESADENIESMSLENIGVRAEIMELKRGNMDLKFKLQQEKMLRIQAEQNLVALFESECLQLQSNTQQRFDSNENKEIYSAPKRIVNTEQQVIHDTPRCTTVRNNLEAMVGAMQHWDGRHLFQDGYSSESTSPDPPSPRSTSPAVTMEIGNSPGNSPSDSQSMVDRLTPTSSLHSSTSSQQQGSASFSSSPSSTIVTSLKNHAHSRNGNSDTDDKVINLEFRTDAGLPKSSPSFAHQQRIVQYLSQQQNKQVAAIVIKHF